MNVLLTSRTYVISAVICVILSLLNNVSCKNQTKPTVTDPLQRVMSRFNLYQVRDLKNIFQLRFIKIFLKDEVSHLMQQLDEKGQTVQWLKSVFSPRRTLLVIDMQNDFISGTLPVPGAEDIIDMVESLTKMDIWYQVMMET